MKKHLFAMAFLLLSVQAAFALIVESGSTIIISAPVHEDIYVVGGTVIIDAPVYGSLIVAGGKVTIRDSVFNDILLAGGDVTLEGYVGGTIRCMGGRLHVFANIRKDLVVAGSIVQIAEKDTIFGSLLATAGDITLDGTVKENIRVRAGIFWLNGRVEGDLDCRAHSIVINGSVKGKATLAVLDAISVGDHAAFSNEVRYWTPDKTASFGHSIESGQPIFDPSLEMQQNHWYLLGEAGLAGFLVYLGMVLAIILLLQYLLPATIWKAGNTVFSHPVRSLVWGLLFLCATPLIILLTMITVIGIPIGLALLIAYISALLLSGSITAVVAANWLNGRSGRNWNLFYRTGAALGIFIVLKLLLATPFLGWQLYGVLAAIAFGAVLQQIPRKKDRPYIPST